MLSTWLRRCSALVFVLLIGAAVRAQAPRVSASLVTSEVTVQNGLADATFRIDVRNEEAQALSNLFVVFADNTEVAIGDVPAEGSAASEPTSHTFDVSEAISAHATIPVTLKYSVDGAQVEQAASVVLRTQQ